MYLFGLSDKSEFPKSKHGSERQTNKYERVIRRGANKKWMELGLTLSFNLNIMNIDAFY